MVHNEKARSGIPATAQPDNPDISLAESVKRTQAVECDHQADYGKLPEEKALAPKPVLPKGDDGFKRPYILDSTESSIGNGEHEEDDNEATSNPSYYATPRSRLSQSTLRRASIAFQESLEKEHSETAVMKRKTMASQSASVSGGRPSKRLKPLVAKLSGEFFEESGGESAEESDERSVEESDEEFIGEDDKDCIGESDEEGVEEARSDDGSSSSVPHKASRRPNARAEGRKPTKSALPRQHQTWTRLENDTMIDLRKQGKPWDYIGDRLRRSGTAVEGHWYWLKIRASKPVQARRQGVKGRLRQENFTDLSAIANMPLKRGAWSKEEDHILNKLRAQGKTLRYVSRRIKGKGYSACKTRWQKIKNQYPQGLEFNGKRQASDHREAEPYATSQPEQETKEAASKPHSATAEPEGHQLSIDGDSPIDANFELSSIKQSYREPVTPHRSLVSVDISKNPTSKATETAHHDTPTSEPFTGGRNLSLGTAGSVQSAQSDPISSLTNRDSKTNEVSSFRKDLLLRGFLSLHTDRGPQELARHRRSHSWSQ